MLRKSGEYSLVMSREMRIYLEVCPGKQAITQWRPTRNTIPRGVHVEELRFSPELDDRPSCLRRQNPVPHCFFHYPTGSSPNEDGASDNKYRYGEQEQQGR